MRLNVFTGVFAFVLGLVCFHCQVRGGIEYVFPPDAGILDVKRDFGAKGDGIADDTAAIQAAVVKSLSGNYVTPRFIYIPNGTYLLSDSIKARVTDAPDGQGGWSDGWRSGMIFIGESRDGVVLKLKDRCEGFTDPKKPRTMIITGSTGHGKGHDSRIGGWGNEAFRNCLMNFTVDSGQGNAGAVGVDFLASNRGTMSDITIRSGAADQSGVCGLDLSRPWPGPALVTRVDIEGFDVGLRQKGMDCSMTYEHLRLRGQRVAGIEAVGQPVMSIRGVISENRVPVLRSVKGGGGILILIDSTFTYTGDDPASAVAIANEDNLLLQRATVKGYQKVVVNGGKSGKFNPDLTLDQPGGTVDFYTSRAPLRLGAEESVVPSLPVKESPQWSSTDLGDWANVKDFGAAFKGTARDFTTTRAFQQVDPKVDFNWGGGGPKSEDGKGIGKDNFAIRWSGQVQVPADGEYTFYAKINDQGRLWVDGKLLIDQWDGYQSKEFEGKIQLKAKQRVPIKLEYWESGHEAWVKLSWSGPDLAKQVIPAENLYPTPDAAEPGGLTGAYYGNDNPDCTEAVQKAIDSGKSVVYFPNGSYPVKGPLILRGAVRKLIGMEAALDGAVVRHDGTVNDSVFIENLNGISVEQNCGKTLVVQRCNLSGSRATAAGTGDVFVNDVIGGRTRIENPDAHWWMRQINSEFGEQPQLINNGARLWILGMKTEGNTTAIVNNAGIVECYALYSMTTAVPAKTTPFVFNNGGWMAVSFADGGQKSYALKIKQILGGKTLLEETWRRETMLYIGGGKGK